MSVHFENLAKRAKSLITQLTSLNILTGFKFILTQLSNYQN